MNCFLNNWLPKSALARLEKKYEQLELQFGLAVLDRAEANNEISRLQIEVADCAEVIGQLQLDLGKARESESALRAEVGIRNTLIRQMEKRLSRFINPPRDPVTKRFVARCV